MLDRKARELVDSYVEKFRPLDLKMRRTWFEYDTTGDRDAARRLEEMELEVRTLRGDPRRFSILKELVESSQNIADPLLRREIEVLYLVHLPNQIDKPTLKRLTAVERRLQDSFNSYRANLDGEKLSPVQADHILSDSTDSSVLEKVWKSQKSVGAKIESDFRELVSIRNEVAQKLGFPSAVELSAKLNEFDLSELAEFYKKAKEITDAPFRRLKEDIIDVKLAERYGIDKAELRPWHYQNAFFQEAPNAAFSELDLDSIYNSVDSNGVISLVSEFYSSMGIDVDKIVSNSSLFPKEGKNPHAVAWLLDPERAGSSVLIMNLPEPPAHPKASDASTLVHELAHDVNYEAILSNGNLPYVLREPTMLTEAFALLMEKQSRTAPWFEKLGATPERAMQAQAAVAAIEAADEMIFMRWAITIYDFETAFYRNPEQDIGDLWWRAVERNQFLQRPEGWKNPDALAKYHIPNVSLLYYSNYAIGKVANVMFAKVFADRVGAMPRSASYFGQRDFGRWLMTDFLAQGERQGWQSFLAKYAKGPLSVEAWKEYYFGTD